MRVEQAMIVSREAQTSNTAIYRKDLPKSGKYTAIDIGIRLTNGATSGINMDILDVIKHISLVLNGNDYRVHMSGQAMFRNYWMTHGRPMPYNFTEAASGVQEAWFRMEFGRFLGDPQFGLDLDRFQNAQIQVDYDATVWGAVGVTTFTTGTFTVTIIAHQFPFGAVGGFRGMFGLREFYTGTSAASGDLVQSLPSANPVLGVGVMAIEDNVAEATDVTDIKIGKDSFSKVYYDGKWYNFQAIQNSGLDVREEIVDLLLSAGATRHMHLANISFATVKDRSITLAAA